jgi:hypothetical protein
MNALLKLFGSCIVLAVILTAKNGAKAQITSNDSPNWQACAAEPTAPCIAELVFSRAPDLDVITRRHLIYAGAGAQVGARWPTDVSEDKTTKADLRMAELARQIRAALLEAKHGARTAIELKTRLQAIDATLPPGLERHTRPISRTDIYYDAAELMTRGIPANVSPGEGSGFGGPERAALLRHLPQRFGDSLDVFIERARELASQEKAWMSFARAMAAIGRQDEALWAIRQLDLKPQPAGSSLAGRCYSRVAALLLDIGEFREADRILGDAPCYEQRAEIAKQYAQKGEANRAKEIAYRVLSGLPAYMQAATRIIDGPRLADTVQPLMIALVRAGDRERALKAIQEMERFVRHEGRHLVSFVGASLGMLQLAQINYDIGEDAKGDALIETAITENDRDQHPAWSKPFNIAYAKCTSGKPNCLEALLSFSGQTVDRATGEQILGWAIRAGRREITAEIVGQNFNIADAWVLNYSKLSLEVLAGDEHAAGQTLSLLLENEKHSGDQGPLLRCIFLLRLAAALERRDLAIEAAKVILSRDFSERSINSGGENWERWPANRTMMLAESSSVLAQLQ